MKQQVLAALALVAMSAPALAIECPMTHAIYGQTASDAEMRFMPVPRTAASNQIAAFRLELPSADARLDGAVHIPNGFGQPHGSLGQDCPEIGADEAAADAAEASPTDCGFWTGVVYALGADGMMELPWDPDLDESQQMAPQQVLLPEFAVRVWYSMLRGPAFEGEKMVSDVFQLTACAK